MTWQVNVRVDPDLNSKEDMAFPGPSRTELMVQAWPRRLPEQQEPTAPLQPA